MQNVNEWLNQLVEFLNQLYGLPGIALVALLCLAGGYALRLCKCFPNEAIPLVLVVLGAALLPLISDFRESALPLRIWLVRNVIVGALIGLSTWLFHKVILKRVEEKFPWIKAVLDGPSDKPDLPVS